MRLSIGTSQQHKLTPYDADDLSVWPREKVGLPVNNDRATFCLSCMNVTRQNTFPDAAGFHQLSITGTDPFTGL